MNLKEIFKDQLDEETVQKLENMLEAKTAELLSQIATLNESAQNLQEEKESLVEEIEFIKQTAEEYGAFLQEQANAFGELIQEQADEKTIELVESAKQEVETTLKVEHATVLTDLKEKAEAYGEHCKEQAKQELLEYTESQIEEFKQEHIEMFESIDEYQRMKHVFTNMKSLLEASGFSIDQDTVVDSLKADLSTKDDQVKDLTESLKDLEDQVFALKREATINEMIEPLADIDKEKIKAIAENISFKSEDELRAIVSILIEKHVPDTTKALTQDLTEQTLLDTSAQQTATVVEQKTTTKSGWGGKLF